jgi:hypothetical protein
MVRRLCLIIALVVCGWLAEAAYAETFTLNNGSTLTGELLLGSANDAGMQIKVGDGKYEKVPWTSFSQEDLKNFVKVQKLAPLVEPFIEVSQADKIKKTEVNIKQPPRLARPAPQSLVGALFSSGLGLLILLLLYGANIYAGYEVAIFRARPTALVCGVSAVLPVAGPIIFLSMPTNIPPAQETWEPAPATAPEGAVAEGVNPMQGAGAEHPAGLKLAGSEPADAVKVGQFEGGDDKANLPATVKYQRGQFTFNRRFIETKFSGFFEYVGQRISRIAANDLHLQVQRGHASEEVMIPFVEIQEIRLRHKDAK